MYYLYSSIDEKPQHEKCPIGAYQRAKSNKESFTHDYKPLPKNVLDAMKPK